MEKEQTPNLASCYNHLYLGITLTTPRGGITLTTPRGGISLTTSWASPLPPQLVWSGAQEIVWFKTSSGDKTQLRLELLNLCMLKISLCTLNVKQNEIWRVIYSTCQIVGTDTS